MSDPVTLVNLWTAARRRLEAAGVSSPVIDARLLVERGAGVSRLEIVTDPYRVMSDEQLEAVDSLLKRREAREPISHILGLKAFWKHDFIVTPDVLTPRPETEFLVEQALALVGPERVARVLELGVGSGAPLLSFLAERPLARGVGVDLSPEALAVARRNAERLELHARAHLLEGDWRNSDKPPFDEAFDLVIANPPYIASADLEGLEPEVARHEPRLALDGGPDGLDAYRAIAEALPRLVKPGGAYAFEVGAGQAGDVAALLGSAGMGTHGVLSDLSGVARIVWGRGEAGAH